LHMSNGYSMKIDWQSIPTCLSQDRNVVAAWIFGSAQGEAVRPGGDIDIGVLFGRKPFLDEMAQWRMAVRRS